MDHTDRLLRLGSDPGFIEDLLAGPGWTLPAWIPGPESPILGPDSDTCGAAAIDWAEGCDH